MSERALERQMKAFNENIKKQFHDDKVDEFNLLDDYTKKDAAMKAKIKEDEEKRKAEQQHLKDIANGLANVSDEFKKAFDNPEVKDTLLSHVNKQIEKSNQEQHSIHEAISKMSDVDRTESMDNLENLIDIEQSKLATAEVAKEKAMDSGNIEEIRAADNAIKEINDRISFYQEQLERVESE